MESHNIHIYQYAYGIPPSPVMSGMPPPGMVYMQPDRQQQQPQFAMRRAGSYNAKMMSQVSLLYLKLSLLHPALLKNSGKSIS